MAFLLVFIGILGVVNIAVAAPENGQAIKIVVKDIIPPFNPCGFNPCLNNGVCQPRGERDFMCLCAEGYAGERCEVFLVETPEMTCPPSLGFGSCIMECVKDEDCADSKGCCFNGCGRQCLDLVPKPKPRPECPIINSIPIGICVIQCDTHDDCGESQACCSTGCGRVCI